MQKTPRPPFLLPVVFLLLAICLAVPCLAQVPAAALAEGKEAEVSTEEPVEHEVASDSPRASLRSFLDLGSDGEWEKAASFLVLPESRKAEGPILAERLKVVLDKYVWFDLEKISSKPDGDEDDDLAPGVEKVAEIPVGEDRVQPVYMVRRSTDDVSYWAFSPATVRRINGWYDQLPDRNVREVLIGAGLHPLLRKGPIGLLWWQWIALPLLLLGAWIGGRVLGSLTRAILRRLTARTDASWDDRLLARIGPQLTFAWGLVIFAWALPSLGLTAQAHGIFRNLVTAGAVIVVFWAAWRSVDVITETLLSSQWAATSPAARNLLAIGANLAKGAIAGAGALAVLSAFGYPVTTLLAGLGIGGLAFAFGAQKSVENLFGSISLAIDQPFRVGDFVKVEDFVGTVEEIGIRSTRFRTLDRTVISIPNGNLSDQRLETFSARDRMRLATTIGLEYSTTHSQMQEVLTGCERVLREHPKIWPDAMVMKFKELGASSLDIEVMAWFQVPAWSDFQLCRQEVLLGFMKVVEDAGTGFAFPTRTVHLINEPTPAPSPRKKDENPPIAPAPPRPQQSTAKPGNLPPADGE